MPRQKGSKNKLTSEIKERLQKIIDQTLDSLDVDDMNTNQKFKLLQLGLQYIMPRLATTTIQEDSPEEEEEVFIQIYDRKKDSDEEVWKDNFEITNTYKVSSLFYTIEKDRYGKSNHAHLLIAGDITKQQFASAMNRNATAELPYWQNINDQDASILYVNKRQNKNDLVQGFGLLSQADVEKEIDLDCGIIPHPNKKYHNRAEYISSKIYGWKKYHRGLY